MPSEIVMRVLQRKRPCPKCQAVTEQVHVVGDKDWRCSRCGSDLEPARREKGRLGPKLRT